MEPSVAMMACMTTSPCMWVRRASLGYAGSGAERTFAVIMPEEIWMRPVELIEELDVSDPSNGAADVGRSIAVLATTGVAAGLFLAALEAEDEALWRSVVEVLVERSTVAEGFFVATAWLRDGEGVVFSDGLEGFSPVTGARFGGGVAVLFARCGDAEWIVLDGASRWKVQ
jgi:hypothetical protein